MPAPAHVSSRLVFTTWIATITDLTADGVGNTLPPDDRTWAANGYIVVPVVVGGSPHSTMPLRRPVGQVECWATKPGSGVPPWNRAADLAEQIRIATYDRTSFGRLLAITENGVVYPAAMVRSAKILTEPRQIWGDVADYAGFSFDLALQWIQVGEVIP